MRIMAKKSKATKKHKFKHVEATRTIETVVSRTEVEVAEASSEAARPAATVLVANPAVVYLTTDLRRISLLIVILVALQLLLWFVFNTTTLDDQIYRALKI